jgi:hypothetical protein
MSKLTHTQIGNLASCVALALAATDWNTLSAPVTAIEDLPEMEPWEIQLKSLVDEDPLLPSYEELGEKEYKILEFLIDYFTPESASIVDHYRDDPTHGIGKND